MHVYAAGGVVVPWISSQQVAAQRRQLDLTSTFTGGEEEEEEEVGERGLGRWLIGEGGVVQEVE